MERGSAPGPGRGAAPDPAPQSPEGLGWSAGPAGPVGADGPTAVDPLDLPDPLRAADSVAVETLLRAYVRETGTDVPGSGSLLYLALPCSALTLRVRVLYRSVTGWHRFGSVRVVTSGKGGSLPADVGLVAAALVRESTLGRGAPPYLGADAVGRIVNSAVRTGAHLVRRRGETPGTRGVTPFLDAEQALLLGHPFHPAPKSREGASDSELDAYSPELRGSFPLHWFAVHPDVLVGESADGRTPAELLRPLTDGLGLSVPDGMTVVPAHPWQARDVLARPAVRPLVDAGLLRPLGPAGPDWYPTSSVRTVHRPDAGVMLKLSLGMRITNSRRNNLRGEMRLGVRAARLLAAGPAGRLRAEHPEFGILRDSGWVSAGVDGDAETGLETAVRDNPFRGGAGDGLCVAGLVAERTGPGDGSPPAHRALLSEAVARTARAHGVSTAEASARWLAAYLDVLAVPLIRLRAWYGIALEPHHQNTLVALGADGLPRAGWYRDSQGYYVAASHAADMERLLPGAADGLDLVFDDAFVDERVAYYLGINNLLGLVGAFGALGLADEGDLLRVLRARLERLRAAEPGAKALLDLLLDAPLLRCKGNYLTCVDGLDELVGDVESQSVYVDLTNPLAEAQR
ncbi:siderophore biosynthesis protein [Streptomyces sp. IB2014 016-6]|nr:siderophore biosynthesis protein [Streptomyces sp. IB2014 016-6]